MQGSDEESLGSPLQTRRASMAPPCVEQPVTARALALKHAEARQQAPGVHEVPTDLHAPGDVRAVCSTVVAGPGDTAAQL